MDDVFRRPVRGIPTVLLVLALAACNRGGTAAPGGARAPGAPAQVTVTTVAAKPWSDTLDALGTAKANESVTLTAKVTETVERVNFQDGDLVEAGQVLVDLSGRAEVAGLEEARAAYKEADQQYKRQVGLVDAGTIARSQLDTQVALRDAAYARMQAIRARLSDRVITAPFAGVLGFRQVSPGTLVTPGTVIAATKHVTSRREAHGARRQGDGDEAVGDAISEPEVDERVVGAGGHLQQGGIHLGPGADPRREGVALGD